VDPDSGGRSLVVLDLNILIAHRDHLDRPLQPAVAVRLDRIEIAFREVLSLEESSIETRNFRRTERISMAAFRWASFDQGQQAPPFAR
jgi:hypothetical protein